MIKTVRGQDCKAELDFVVEFYKNDINPTLLMQQLKLLATKFSSAEQPPDIIDIRVIWGDRKLP